MPDRPGYLSTEFFALLLLAAVIVADGTAFINITTETLTAFMAAVVAYIAQRGLVKNAVAKNDPTMLANAIKAAANGDG